MEPRPWYSLKALWIILLWLRIIVWDIIHTKKKKRERTTNQASQSSQFHRALQFAMCCGFFPPADDTDWPSQPAWETIVSYPFYRWGSEAISGCPMSHSRKTAGQAWEPGFLIQVSSSHITEQHTEDLDWGRGPGHIIAASPPGSRAERTGES